MRTTVDIPDNLYRELKGRAATQGETVKQLLVRGAELVLCEGSQPVARRLKGPMLTGGEPGSLKLDNEKVYDLISFP